jgi:hypothetical protein
MIKTRHLKDVGLLKHLKNSVIYHIKRLKKKNSIISTDVEKAFDKI